MRQDRRPGGTYVVARLSSVALVFALGFAVVYYVTVRTVPGRRLGDTSLRGGLLTRSALTGTVDVVLNVVSIATLLGAVAVVAVIALVRLARLQGLAAIGLLVGANGSAWLLKNALLERPDLGISEVAPATLNSLPSGHSTAVFSALAALLFVLPRRWRLAGATVGAVATTVVAVATMSAGWHRPGDSVAAFLLVGLWTTLAVVGVVVGSPRRPDDLTHSRAQSRTQSRTQSRARSPRWLAACAAGASVLGLVLAVGLVSAPVVRDSAVGSTTGFLAGALLIVGAATGVLVGILAVLALMEPNRPPGQGPSTPG